MHTITVTVETPASNLSATIGRLEAALAASNLAFWELTSESRHPSNGAVRRLRVVESPLDPADMLE